MKNRERRGEILDKVCQRFLFVPVIVVIISVLVLVFNWYDRFALDIGRVNTALNGQDVEMDIEKETKADKKNKADVPKNISKMTESDTKIDINSASIEELMRLPGIGAVKAAAVVEARAKMGGFRTLEDLTCVEGISTKIFERLKPFVGIKTMDAE